MESFVQTFSDLIRDRLGELQLNAFSAENAAGLPPDAIRNVLRSEKQSGPTLARTKEICDALGLEILIAPKHRIRADIWQQNAQGLDAAAPAGFLTIPWAEAGLGAGSAPVSFSRAWLDIHELKIDFLKAALPDRVEIEGAAAEDTIAVLDTRPGLRKGHGLWCYRQSGLVVVAHVTFADSITIIHPARQDQPPEVLKDAANLGPDFLGKVVWLGQNVPFKGRIR